MCLRFFSGLTDVGSIDVGKSSAIPPVPFAPFVDKSVTVVCCLFFFVESTDDRLECDDIDPDEYDPLDLDLERDESYDDLEYDLFLPLRFLRFALSILAIFVEVNGAVLDPFGAFGFVATCFGAFLSFE